MIGRNKFIIGSAFVLTLTGTATLYHKGYFLPAGQNGLNERIISVVSARGDGTTNLHPKQLAQLAKSYRVTVVELETLIANEIRLQRQQVKDISGGYEPGIHIVKGSDDDRIDPNQVRLVDGIMDFDNIQERRGFRNAEEFRSDKSIYIEPADSQLTELAKARFLGYFTAGKYLPGSSYAQTENLRKLEETPSGRSGWTSLTRIYSGYEHLGTVVLEESDFLASGGVVLVPEGTLNATVGTYRATLSRFQDNAGRTMTHLDWTDKDQHNYSLNIQQTDEASVASLMRIAESIAKARR